MKLEDMKQLAKVVGQVSDGAGIWIQVFRAQELTLLTPPSTALEVLFLQAFLAFLSESDPTCTPTGASATFPSASAN